MKNIKKTFILLMSLVFIVSLSACNNSESDSDISELSPAEITEEFFTAFETSDYETMKLYCTESCVEDYFHGNNVFGMVSAKAINIQKDPEVLEDGKYAIFVDVEMETAETSSLHPDTKTSFYVVLEKMENSSFFIDSFVTGL